MVGFISEALVVKLQGMRSKLFVPGSRPELFPKALASAADAISIDLEDAVLEERKAEARAIVATWLRQGQRPRSEKRVIVRVNAMDTPHFADDVAAVVQPGLDILNLPKPASVDAVRAAAQALVQAERANGVSQPVRLLLNIETPQALREAAALAQASPRVMGLQVGLGDLFEPLGIDRKDVDVVRQILLTIRMAAGEAGVMAMDGAYADVGNAPGYLAEAAMARRLGYVGKSCIHPSQIALANQAFSPTAAEIAQARRVVDAAAISQAAGVGAYLVDGRMIDRPFLLRAEAILALAQRLGLTAEE